MPSYQSLKDDALLAESYYDNVHARLLLETPATEANIERMYKKYFSRGLRINMEVAREMHNPPFGPGGPFNEEEELKKAKALYRPTVVYHLDHWTNGIQQVLKQNGGEPDIFGYPTFEAVKEALQSAVSKTSQKKAYKKADPSNVPVVLETEKYNVYQPKTWEACRKYFGETRISLLDGQQKPGAPWCVAASMQGKGPEHFHNYVNTNKDRLLFFIRKSDDKLFATRCKQIGTLPSENLYEIWYKKADQVIKDAREIANSAELAAARAAKDERKIERIMGRIANLALKLEPKQVLEIRNQENAILSGLPELCTRLNNDDPSVLEYAKFVAFVVFGKTI